MNAVNAANALTLSERYQRLGPALRRRFGQPAMRVTLRGGFGCPNRDGRIGQGGCTFCSSAALVPRFDAGGSVGEQLERGLQRLAGRALVAYFQEGSATDAPPEQLRDLYSQAIRHRAVLALSIGTRPDCLPDEVLDILEELRTEKPVWLELGLQVASDRLLRSVNRNHTVAQFAEAVRRAHARGLEVIAHVILDLPGAEEADRIETARCLNALGVAGVKIHNLHVLSGTPLADAFRRGALALSTLEEYACMAADFLERLRAEVVVHRLTGEGPAELMLAPDWVRHKQQVLALVDAVLADREGFQGRRAV